MKRMMVVLFGLLLFSNLHADGLRWVVGRLDALYGDDKKGQTSQMEYVLTLNRIKMVRLDLSQWHDAHRLQSLLGKQVEIQVTLKNYRDVQARNVRKYTVLNIRQRTPKTSPHAAAGLSQDHSKKPWLNLLCKFGDITDVPHPLSFYQTLFSNDYPYIEHYWKTTTFGHIDIAGTQTIDWVTLPHDHAYYKPDGEEMANTELLQEECIAAAGVESILNSYHGINLFFNGAIFDHWSGWGGTSGTTWINLGSENTLVVAHEMGHGYGLPHSSGRYGQDYDSPWDLMSGGGGSQEINGTTHYIPSHPIALYKQRLGAISDNAQWSNEEIDASHGERIHLARLEESAQAGDYLIANVYSPDRTKHYTVEARDKVGYDFSLPAKAVIIHEIEEVDVWGSRAYVVDPDNNGDLSDEGAQWQEGETFTDTDHNISIEILSKTSTGYDIRITAPRAIPNRIDEVHATTNLIGKVRITWNPLKGADYYAILKYTDWEVNSTFARDRTQGNETYFDDTNGTASYHYYRVKACNSAGCSTVEQYPVSLGRSTFVTDINATTDRNDTVHITWSPVTGAEYYEILKYDSWEINSSFRVLHTRGSETAFDDTNDTYLYHYYRVNACTSTECSSVQPYVYAEGKSIYNITATHGAYPDKIVVNFQEVPHATKYTLWRVLANNTHLAHWVADGTHSPLEDTHLKADTHYAYYLEVHLDDNRSFQSARTTGYTAKNPTNTNQTHNNNSQEANVSNTDPEDNITRSNGDSESTLDSTNDTPSDQKADQQTPSGGGSGGGAMGYLFPLFALLMLLRRRDS